MDHSSDQSSTIRQSELHRESRGDVNFRSATKEIREQQHHASTSAKEKISRTKMTGDEHASRTYSYDASLSCDNRPHSFFPEWTGSECDHDSFFCFSEGINNHCCKCRPECCGQCNVTASYNDPYRACPLMIDGRVDDFDDFEQQTKIIVLCVIAVVLACILFITCCMLRNQKRTEMDPDYDKKRNLQELREDEYGSEGNFLENDDASSTQSL